MKKEYLENKIVKSLLGYGFSEDYIEKAIENGDVVVDVEEKEEEEEDSDKKEKKEKEEKEEIKEKSLSSDILKSFEDKMLEGNANFQKSIDAFGGILKSMAGVIESLQSDIKTLKTQTPEFKGAGLENFAHIQKSIEDRKDDNGKIAISVTQDRALAKKVIEEIYDAASPDIKKSIADDTKNFLINPESESVSEELAKLAYEKGYKFQK